MYGLLLEGIRLFITSHYGEDQWNAILKMAGVDSTSFSIHEVYGETMIPKLVEAASKFLNISVDDIMFENGKFFVSYVSQYGYDGVLKVLGRDLRDFLNGLDNLHEYLRFSYNKLNPPSFFCVNESKTGITLQYRSRRRGFAHYVRGQITEISRVFYKTQMEIEIVSHTEHEGVHNCIMRLHFNNLSFVKAEDHLPVPSEVFFEVFPFNLVFNRGMKIINIGRGVHAAMSSVLNDQINDTFILCRPLIEFTWDHVMLHTNNIFELVYTDKDEIKELRKLSAKTMKKRTLSRTGALKLRGQMKYMPEWDAIVFLGTPIMRDVDSMWKVGLFINDLSMHDSSRDLVLAGEQQSAELKLALEQEHEKSKKLVESLKRLDDEMKRTDELLYQMIPKSVAERLRRGEAAVSTCETFDDVTILFSDVVGFTTICSAITPLEVVGMLNTMYSVFDELSERHKVYKVETIGDAYMIASGCPTVTKFHAPLIIEMALDMITSICTIKDPSKSVGHLQIRVGIHSGQVVGGVVGLKMPRYCLFGDCVNTANRMESNSAPQKIHVSETTKAKLEEYKIYRFSDRGEIEVKGKGKMKTFFMDGRKEDTDPDCSKLLSTLERERQKMADSNLSSSQTRGEGWESVSQSRASSAMSTSRGLATTKNGAPDSLKASRSKK